MPAAARLLTALRLLLLAAGALPWALVASARATALFFPMFRAFCHQMPERTLVLGGTPMVVCSRCAGVFAGVAIGALLALPQRLLPVGRALVIGAVALATLDVITQDVGLHPPFHPVRLATGLAMGWTGSAFLVASLAREARARDAGVSA
jgi:uncharacterized membrane protein